MTLLENATTPRPSKKCCSTAWRTAPSRRSKHSSFLRWILWGTRMVLRVGICLHSSQGALFSSGWRWKPLRHRLRHFIHPSTLSVPWSYPNRNPSSRTKVDDVYSGWSTSWIATPPSQPPLNSLSTTRKSTANSPAATISSLVISPSIRDGFKPKKANSMT